MVMSSCGFSNAASLPREPFVVDDQRIHGGFTVDGKGAAAREFPQPPRSYRSPGAVSATRAPNRRRAAAGIAHALARVGGLRLQRAAFRRSAAAWSRSRVTTRPPPSLAMPCRSRCRRAIAGIMAPHRRVRQDRCRVDKNRSSNRRSSAGTRPPFPALCRAASDRGDQSRASTAAVPPGS